MIDIVPNKEQKLRNIQQIGTPGEEDRIYVERKAYERIHMEELPEKRVFVFMGHTQRKDQRYATFIETAIPVHNIEFAQSIPQWSNHAWNEVFQGIKQNAEESIIVGWGLDIKGFLPKVTKELEAIHQEQFGGAHQLLMLLDSLEQEEYFYCNKSGHLRPKNGFYIYEKEEEKNEQSEQKEESLGGVDLELPQEFETHFAPARVRPQEILYRQVIDWDDSKEERAEKSRPSPRYREVMYQGEPQTEKKKSSSYVMAAAILLLIAVVGAGIYQDRVRLSDIENLITTMSEKLHFTDTQQESESESVPSETNTAEDSQPESITIEEIPGGSLVEENAGENPAPAETQPQPSSAVKSYYTVRTGDTLLKICDIVYGNRGRYREILELNQLDDPNDIRVGQQLVLP